MPLRRVAVRPRRRRRPSPVVVLLPRVRSVGAARVRVRRRRARPRRRLDLIRRRGTVDVGLPRRRLPRWKADPRRPRWRPRGPRRCRGARARRRSRRRPRRLLRRRGLGRGLGLRLRLRPLRGRLPSALPRPRSGHPSSTVSFGFEGRGRAKRDRRSGGAFGGEARETAPRRLPLLWRVAEVGHQRNARIPKGRNGLPGLS